jgi:hypothetical protein
MLCCYTRVCLLVCLLVCGCWACAGRIVAAYARIRCVSMSQHTHV